MCTCFEDRPLGKGAGTCWGWRMALTLKGGHSLNKSSSACFSPSKDNPVANLEATAREIRTQPINGQAFSTRPSPTAVTGTLYTIRELRHYYSVVTLSGLEESDWKQQQSYLYLGENGTSLLSLNVRENSHADSWGQWSWRSTVAFCLVGWFRATMKLKNKISSHCHGDVVLKL